MGLPNRSRETKKFSGANGDKKYFIFPVQLADREQDWQPCPVVMVIHIHKLYIHTAVVTHIGGGGNSFLFIYFIFYLYQVLVFLYSIFCL